MPETHSPLVRWVFICRREKLPLAVQEPAFHGPKSVLCHP